MGKDKHHAFLGTATGKALFRQLVFDNNREGFEKLLGQVEALKVQHGLRQVVFGLESTANYHKPLGEYLIQCGHQVVFVSGVAVKEKGKCLFYEYPEMALRDLRDLLSLKRRLKRIEHGHRVGIKNSSLGIIGEGEIVKSREKEVKSDIIALF